jgi:hypothetical protein
MWSKQINCHTNFFRYFQFLVLTFNVEVALYTKTKLFQETKYISNKGGL